jgi:hypothetical protein
LPFSTAPLRKDGQVVATNYYSRVSTVLAAVALAAMVAMLVAYGTASAQIMPGALSP